MNWLIEILFTSSIDSSRRVRRPPGDSLGPSRLAPGQGAADAPPNQTGGENGDIAVDGVMPSEVDRANLENDQEGDCRGPQAPMVSPGEQDR